MGHIFKRSYCSNGLEYVLANRGILGFCPCCSGYSSRPGSEVQVTSGEVVHLYNYLRESEFS